MAPPATLPSLPFHLFVLLPRGRPPLSISSHIIKAESKKQEVMWPRLVVNKLLGVPLGSNTFIADIPSTVSSPEFRHQDKPVLCKRASDDRKGTHKYKLFASTWNVGGIPPSDDLNLEDWLDTKNDLYDIYVLGFQEIVPLCAKNVLGPEKSRISMKWNSIIRATLNNSLPNKKGGQEPLVGEKQKVYPVKNDGSMEGIKQGYRCIISKQMVGILVSVWVRSDLRRYIHHPSVSCVGCGFMGCLGNKGSVTARFFLHGTSFCFVCCHLASGGREGDEMHRNSDAMEIFSRTSFPRSPCLPQRILDHDRIILLGDLNYRISLPHARTRRLVERKEWDILLENDQLRWEVSKGRAFEGWHEGTIAFSPTYKYYPNSDEYYGRLQGKKGEKRRAPAWCDRILWYGRGLKQTNYERCQSRLSDHRAVRAFFTVEVDVSKSMNSLRNFFLSERFDRMKNHFDLFSTKELLSCRRSSIQA